MFSLLLHPCSCSLMRSVHLAWFLRTAVSCCRLAHIYVAEEVPKELFTCLQTWEASSDGYCPFVFGRSLCSQKKAKKSGGTLAFGWVGGEFVFNPWLKNSVLVHKGGEENQCNYSMKYCLGAEILMLWWHAKVKGESLMKANEWHLWPRKVKEWYRKRDLNQQRDTNTDIYV